MEFKKSELYQTLFIIAAKSSEGQMIGLLYEGISLGLKRRLQKIHAEAVKFYNEYTTDKKEVEEKFKDDPEKLKSELQILDDEIVKLTCDHVSLALIEEIKTDKNYDFKLIEKFAK